MQQDEYKLADDALRTYINLKPELPLAYHSFGRLKRIEGNYEESAKYYQNALEKHLNSKTLLGSQYDALFYIDYGEALGIIGEHEEALKQFDKAFEAGEGTYMDVALGYLYARNIEQAIEYYNKVLVKYPKYPLLNTNLYRAYWANGDYNKALKTFHDFKVMEEFPNVEKIYEKVFKGKEINKTTAQEYFKYILEEANKAEPPLISTLSQAVLYSFIEDNDHAIEMLQKSFQSGSLFVARMIQGPYFDNLHSDEKFLELIKKMKLDKYMKSIVSQY